MFFDGADVPSSVRKGSLQCVENLSQCLDFSEYASLVVHPLIRCLDRHSDVRPQAMDTLASIVAQLGKGSCRDDGKISTDFLTLIELCQLEKYRNTKT